MASASFARVSVRPSAVTANGSFTVAARRAFAASSAMRSAAAMPSSPESLESCSPSAGSVLSGVTAPADRAARRRLPLGAGSDGASGCGSSEPVWAPASATSVWGAGAAGPPAGRVARRRRLAGPRLVSGSVVSAGSAVAAAVVVVSAGALTSTGGPAGRDAARRLRCLCPD